MGRIKTKQIKRVTIDVVEKHGKKLGEGFEKNKKIIDTLVDVKSKKLRNAIAGYATKLVKAQKQEE